MIAQNPESPEPHDVRPLGSHRRGARLAAVQALYQIEFMSEDAESVILEFLSQRHGVTLENERIIDMDDDFFADLVRGAVRRQREVDSLITGGLAEDWRLERIESVLRGILRCGVYELLLRTDVPARVVINEYVEVADAFFSDQQRKFVNAILDRIARELRPDELSS